MDIDSVYAIYGLRVERFKGDLFRLDDDPGMCVNDGNVGYITAGKRGQHMLFLAVKWDRIPTGEYVFHSGEKPNEHIFVRDRWNSDLRATADRIGLEITGEPGWYTIPSEG
jgi:hypothetical protein